MKRKSGWLRFTGEMISAIVHDPMLLVPAIIAIGVAAVAAVVLLVLYT